MSDVIFKSEKTGNPEKYEHLEELRKQMRNTLIDNLESKEGKIVKALKFGIIGSGAAGSRLAEQFDKLGYSVCCFNTSLQDLNSVTLSTEKKLHIDSGLGGAGKDLQVGQEVTEQHETEIRSLIEANFGKEMSNIDCFLVCTSLSGGSGSGSIVPLLQLLSEYQIPINVLAVLPLTSEGVVAKANTLESLEKLSKLSVGKVLNSLIIIDNSKIEQLYPDVSVASFYKAANFDICNQFDTFNKLSATSTDVAIDPTDYARILSSGNCTIYGKIDVALETDQQGYFLDEDKLADAMVSNLENGLLVEGFDFKDALRCGVYLCGNRDELDKIPASIFNYAFASLNEELDNADLFRGIYFDDSLSGQISIYTICSGLGLPRERMEILKDEVDNELHQMKEKEKKAKQKMDVFQQTQQKDNQDYQRRKNKNTTFGKMVNRKRSRN